MSSDELEEVLDAQPSAAEVEVVEDRTVDSKTFETSTPGVYRTEFYTAPVHFLDEKGDWVDVSPDLVAEGGGLATAGVPFEARFGVEGSGSDVVITTASGPRIGFDLGEAADPTPDPATDPSVPVEGETVEAGDVVPIDDLNLGLVTPWPSTSVEVAVTGTGIKEMLYLSDSSAPSVFEFPLTLDGVTAVLTEAGSVDFIDGSGERVGTIPPAWMEDANLHEVTGEGVISTGARWELDKTDTGTELLRLVLDEKWLYSPDRAFPVRVDPTIVLGDDEAIDDTFVVPYSPGDRSLWDHIKIGHGGMFTNRTYINVAGLSQISGKTIGHAELVLQQYGAACDSDPEDEPDTTGIEVYRVDEDWTGSSSNATVWDGPSVDVLVDSFSETVPACGGSFDRSIRLNVTEAVEQWASGGWAQQGLSVRAEAEFDVNMFRIFRSAQGSVSPKFDVLWSDPPTPGQSPETPDDITPEGVTGSQAPTISATFDDPQATDTGHVEFHLFLDDAPIASGTGGVADVGDLSSWTTPPTLVWNETYELTARAVDGSGHVSAWSDPVFFTTEEPTLIDADIDEDTVWGPEDSPYVITETISVANDATLTILAGTVVKMGSGGPNSLSVNGQLLAVGNESQPVYITSIHDDSVGGDTDGVPIPAARSDWSNIDLKGEADGLPAPAHVLDHTVVRWGGTGNTNCLGSGGEMIAVQANAVVFISNSEITDSGRALIQLSDVGEGTLMVSNSLLDRASECAFNGPRGTFVGNTFGADMPLAYRSYCNGFCQGKPTLSYNRFDSLVKVAGDDATVRYNTFNASATGSTYMEGFADLTLNYWGGDTPGVYPALTAEAPRWTPAMAEAQAPVFGPVNAVTGELTWQESDLWLADAGADLSWDRTYRSQHPGSGGLGANWFTSYSESATGSPATAGSVTSASGTALGFATDPLDYGSGSGGGQQIPSAGNNASWDGSGGASTFETADRTQYEFDAGVLIGVVQRDPGREISIDHGTGGLVDLVTGVSGRTIDPSITTGGEFDNVVDSQGRTVDYTVASGRLTEVRPLGATEPVTYTYGGPGGQLTAITSSEDRPTLQVGYLSDGRVEWFDTAAGGRVDVAYHPEGLYTLFTKAAGTADEVVIRIDYDDFDEGAGTLDRLVAQTILGFRGTHTVYDGWGRVAVRIDGLPEGAIRPDTGPAVTPYAPAVTATVYDDEGDPVTTVDASGSATRTTFNADHQPETTTYADGSAIHRWYAEQRVERIVRLQDTTKIGKRWWCVNDDPEEDANPCVPRFCAGESVCLEWTTYYDDFGQLIELCDPLTTTALCDGLEDAAVPGAGQRGPMEYAYDESDGDPLWVDNTAGERTTFVTVSAEGWPLTVKDPLNRETDYEYTLWGQVKKTTTPNGAVTETTFDEDRLPTRVDEPEGKVTTYEYDSRGRLWHRVDAAGYTTEDSHGFTEEATTTLGYDNVGNLTTITDPLNGTVVRNYNGAGDLEDETDPSDGVTNYLWETTGRASGLPDAIIDPDLNSTTVRYDNAGRVTTVIYPEGGGTVSTTYDVLGREETRTGPRVGATWSTQYDLLGRPAVVTGPAGFDIVYDFDDVDNLVEITDELDTTTVYTFDAADRPTTATDAIGSLWTVTYDTAGQVTRRQDGTGAYTDFAYNPDGFVNKITRQTGTSTTSVQYFPNIDNAGRIVEAVDPRAYAASSACRTTTWASSPDTCYGTVTTYDHLDRVTQVAHPAGTNSSPSTVTEQWFYDDNGNQRFWIDRRGKTWEYSFDASNRPVSTLDPAGQTSRTCWTPGGDMYLEVDASGAATSYTYDNMHRPASATYGSATGVSCPLMSFTGVGDDDDWEYELDGQIDVADVGGTKADYNYNEFGWLETIADGAGEVTTFEAFDNLGRPRLTWDPTKVSRTATYDARGRLTDDRLWHGTSPLGCARQALGEPLHGQPATDCAADLWHHSYDLADRVIETQWPSWNGTTGRRQVFTYDKAGRTKTAADGLGNTTTYAWDQVDNQTHSTVPGGSGSYVWAFDRSNFQISETPPGLSATTWTSDGAGNPTSMTEPSGRVTAYERDDLARVTEEMVTYAGTSQSRWFGFDEAGRTEWAHGPALSSLGDPTSGWDIDAVFDAAGRLDTVTQGGHTVDYDWDSNQRLETRRLDENVVESYTYDNRGFIMAIGGVTPIEVHSRDDAGRVTRLDTLNGSTNTYEDFGYDDAGRPDEHYFRKEIPSNTEIWRQDTAYNVDGDIDSSVTTVGTTRTADTITYDTAGRIDVLTRVWDPSTTTSSDESTATVDYGWNSRGDRTSAVVTGTGGTGTITPAALGVPGNGTHNWTFSVGGRLTGGPNGATYTYDGDNRLTRENRPSAADTKYTYDHFGDLDKIETGDSSTWTTTADWTRDAFARPSSVTSGGATRTFAYDGLAFAPVAVTTGSTTTTLTHTPDGQLVGASDTTTGPQRTLTNNHGDFAAVVPTGGTNNLTGSTVYGPFGTPATTGTNVTSLGYQTQLQDPATGIVDTPTRVYDPAYGRFLQADTWDGDNTNPISLNHYTYANASPYSMSDPTGMWGIDFIGSAMKSVKAGTKAQKQQTAQKKQQLQEQSWEGAVAGATLLNQFFAYENQPGTYADWGWLPGTGDSYADLNDFQIAMANCQTEGRSESDNAGYLQRAFRGCVADTLRFSIEYFRQVYDKEAPNQGVCDNSAFETFGISTDACETVAAVANGIDDVREGAWDTVGDPLGTLRTINQAYNKDGAYGALAAGAELVVAPIIAAGDCLINGDNMERLRCGTAIATGIAISLATGPVASKLGGATQSTGPRWGGRMQGDRGAIDFSNGKSGGGAEAARDAAGLKPNGMPNRDSAVYIGVEKDGNVAGVGSRPGGIHAEDAAQAQMPGGQMTQPMGWRRNPATGQLEWTPVEVCAKCQGNYPPDLFPPDVTAVEGGPWGR